MLDSKHMLYMYYIYYYNTNALYPTNYNCNNKIIYPLSRKRVAPSPSRGNINYYNSLSHCNMYNNIIQYDTKTKNCPY